MTIEGRRDGIDGGRIRLGMVGGGQGAFIGAVHRLAARMDDQYCLWPARSRATRRGPEFPEKNWVSLPIEFTVISRNGETRSQTQ